MLITRLPFHISRGIQEYLTLYVQTWGPIVGLDSWAQEHGFTPCWVNRCAQQAAQAGHVRLTRLEDLPGRPYLVEPINQPEE